MTGALPLSHLESRLEVDAFVKGTLRVMAESKIE
jgi:hypothetical protein